MKPNKDWLIEFLETFTKERKTKAGVKLSGIIWSVLGEEPELVLAFIQQLLNQQREEIREMVEGMEFSERQRSEKEDGYHFVKGFNQALQDLLTKLGSNTEGV